MTATKDGPAQRVPVLHVSVLGIMLLAPVVVLGLSPWRVDSSSWYFGMLPTVMGLFVGPRLGYVAAVATPAAMGIALLLRDSPGIGGVYMAALGLLVGLSAIRGWNVLGAFAAPLAAMALIGAPRVVVPGTGQASIVADSTLTAGFVFIGIVLVGGLWTAFIGHRITAMLHLRPPALVPVGAARYFAAALAVLTGAAAYVSMRWLASPDSWWIILTLFVVVQPYYLTSLRRIGSRVGGTLVGAIVAILVVEVLHDYPFVITVVALALTVAAPWANLKRPYWMSVLFLTPAVVLQTAGGPHAIVTSAVERVLYTIIGAAAAVLVLSIGHAYIRHAFGKKKTSRNSTAESTDHR